jgi:hypothetical protein
VWWPGGLCPPIRLPHSDSRPLFCTVRQLAVFVRPSVLCGWGRVLLSYPAQRRSTHVSVCADPPRANGVRPVQLSSLAEPCYGVRQPWLVRRPILFCGGWASLLFITGVWGCATAPTGFVGWGRICGGCAPWGVCCQRPWYFWPPRDPRGPVKFAARPRFAALVRACRTRPSFAARSLTGLPMLSQFTVGVILNLTLAGRDGRGVAALRTRPAGLPPGTSDRLGTLHGSGYISLKLGVLSVTLERMARPRPRLRSPAIRSATLFGGAAAACSASTAAACVAACGCASSTASTCGSVTS